MSWSDHTPLAGIKVLDLTRVVAGPFATMQLGDLGADIVKIEEPGAGDESRAFGPPFLGGESAYFLSVNRNKRSCAIDLRADAGKELVLRLGRMADVVVENFRPGTLERLGLGYDALSRDNGDLIFCSVTGFGRSGPDARRPGYDLIVQGESGVMDITGEPDGKPTKVGTSIADMVSSLYAAQAILAALLRRERTGLGARLDVAMLDAMASLLTFNAGIYFSTGVSPKRRGNIHPTITPYEPFETQDGWINIGVANDKFWRLFCPAIGRPDLIEDRRFAHAPDRVTHRAELKAILDPIFRGPDAAPLAQCPGKRRRAVRRDKIGGRSLRNAATRRTWRGQERCASDRRRREIHRQSGSLRRSSTAGRRPAAADRRTHRRSSERMARLDHCRHRQLFGSRRLRRKTGRTGDQMTGEAIVIDRASAQALIERALSDPRQEFGSFFLSRLFGLRISYDKERCIVEFEAVKAFFNPQGSLHGGVLATAMDISMGHLLHHVDTAGATLAMTIQYLAPVTSGTVRCEASFLRRGRSISALQSEAFGPDGDRVAHATATWKRRPSK